MSTTSLSLAKTTTMVVNGLAITLVIVAGVLGWRKLQTKNADPQLDATATSGAATPSIVDDTAQTQADLPAFSADLSAQGLGIVRSALMNTNIPSRPRVDVTTYMVEQGDNLFSIAENFNLKPETILWGNFEVLEDNPQLLKTGQSLNILPTNGTYYKWSEGDSIGQVASFFKVDSKTILEYPGNRFDLTLSEDEVEVETGTWLIVPGGQRAIKDWGPPAISRSNPASAAFYGPGFCGAIYEGAIGTYTFVWPTPSHTLTQLYDPVVHRAIDIGGGEGNAIFAADHGVVVYAGWSNWGYGYLIVIDHGTGWQTAYAHLSAVAVTCGQSVFQGTRIGALGNTGNSTGPHLHFEMIFNGAKVNPLNFVQ
ncbi:MAG: M23 family metallopeptidase [Chloroflexi bacterium]|nr:M23 family metallopeptidase [Chloroflexota bacterium]